MSANRLRVIPSFFMATATVMAFALAVPMKAPSASSDRNKVEDGECFFRAEIKWDDGIENADREVIFRNIMEKIGLIYKSDRIRYFDIDYFHFRYFNFGKNGRCQDTEEKTKENIKYSILNSAGPYIYGSMATDPLSDITYSVESASQSAYSEKYSSLSSHKSFSENFEVLSQTDDLSNCTVRLTFPLGADGRVTIGGINTLQRSNVYHASYLYNTRRFFGFPIFSIIPDSFVPGIDRTGEFRSVTDEHFDNLYIIYYAHCAQRVEMTRIFMKWAEHFVGIPFDTKDVTLTERVDMDEIQRVIRYLDQ